MAKDAYNESIAQIAAERVRLKAEVAKLSALDDEARARFEDAKPHVPDEICVEGINDRMTLDTRWFRPPVYIPGRPQTVPAEGWRAMLANPPRLFGSDKVNEKALQRIHVGLAAAERYEELVRKADLVAGYSAANDAYEAALDRLWELDARILAMKAQSPDDVVLQAEVVEERLADDGEVPAEFISGLLSSIKALGVEATA